MKRPTDQQFDTALMWLAANDGDGGEAEACKAVAEWLDHELNLRQRNETVWVAARHSDRRACTSPRPPTSWKWKNVGISEGPRICSRVQYEYKD